MKPPADNNSEVSLVTGAWAALVYGLHLLFVARIQLERTTPKYAHSACNPIIYQSTYVLMPRWG